MASVKQYAIALAAAATVTAGFAGRADALVWEGINWSESGLVPGDSWSVNGSGHAVLDIGTNNSAVRELIVGGGPSNPFNLPTAPGSTGYVTFSFIDNQLSDSNWPIIDLFWNGTGGGPNNQRGRFGASYPTNLGTNATAGWRLEDGTPFTNTYGQNTAPIANGSPFNGIYAEPGYGSPNQRTPSFAVLSGSNFAITDDADGDIGPVVPRINGSEVKIGILKNADGSITFSASQNNGPTQTWTTDYYLNPHGVSIGNTANWIFNQVELRVIFGGNNDSEQFVLTNFEAFVPEPASALLACAGAAVILPRRRRAATGR